MAATSGSSLPRRFVHDSRLKIRAACRQSAVPVSTPLGGPARPARWSTPVGELALRVAHLRRGIESARPRTCECRAVGHRAHHRHAGTEPAGKVGGTQSGGHRDDQRPRPQRRCQRMCHGGHLLRLHREHDDPRSGHRGLVVVGDVHAVITHRLSRAAATGSATVMRCAATPLPRRPRSSAPCCRHRSTRWKDSQVHHPRILTRGPKRAVPMRSNVDPSFTAASRSPLMPIDRVSSASPCAVACCIRYGRCGNRRAAHSHRCRKAACT